MADNTKHAPVVKAARHRKWIVHSHEATRPTTSGAMSDINITPLIDVMLVLLIIFMVVTPLAQKGLDIALPQPDPSASAADTQQNPNQVVMTLEEAPGGGAVISVNKNPVSNLDDLATKLRDIFQTKSDKTMFVKAGGKIPYGKVVEAMDIARGSGVERIGIISESMDSGGAPAAPVAGGTGQ
jgi:biopolymer transport protein TolR